MTAARGSTKTLREKGLDRFQEVLAAILTAGLEEALAAGDQERVVALINRAFAEGSPQLGCRLLCRASEVVGAARTWTVRISPPSGVSSRSVTPGALAPS